MLPYICMYVCNVICSLHETLISLRIGMILSCWLPIPIFFGDLFRCGDIYVCNMPHSDGTTSNFFSAFDWLNQSLCMFLFYIIIQCAYFRSIWIRNTILRDCQTRAASTNSFVLRMLDWHQRYFTRRNFWEFSASKRGYMSICLFVRSEFEWRKSSGLAYTHERHRTNIFRLLAHQCFICQNKMPIRDFPWRADRAIAHDGWSWLFI
jgi:hypothetical protein